MAPYNPPLTKPNGHKPASWKDLNENESFDIFSKYTTKLDSPQLTSERERPALWDICNGCVLWLPPKHTITPSILHKYRKLLKLDKRSFNHPIMVLDIAVSGPEDAVVTFARMTSKSSITSDADKLQALRHGSYMKIFHRGVGDKRPLSVEDDEIGRDSATSNTDLLWNGWESESSNNREVKGKCTQKSYFSKENLLYLDEKEGKNRCMTEDSYVDLSAVYVIDWQELQCYAVGQKPDGYRHRLQEESFSKLAERLKLKLKSPVSAWVATDQLWETFHHDHIERYLASNPPHTLRATAPEFVPDSEG